MFRLDAFLFTQVIGRPPIAKLFGVVVLVLVPFLSGCTSALWKGETFTSHHRPATPDNLRLFYSPERKDILVIYSERKDTDANIRTRSYWLEANTTPTDRDSKPDFKSAKSLDDLMPIPISSSLTSGGDIAPGLRATRGRDDEEVRLFAGDRELLSFRLPVYERGQWVYQVLLTPGAVAGDVTAAGALHAIQPGGFLDGLADDR